MHPRVSLHQVGFMEESTGSFIAHCRAIGIQHMTLVTPKLMSMGGLNEAAAALVAGGPRVATVNHVFATFPNLALDNGSAAQKLVDAINIAATLGASAIYLLTGGRGSLNWEGAAERFAQLIAPCIEAARGRNLTLLVENANALNADIHIAHTLADAITLAEVADIGLCMELHACWMEAGYTGLFDLELVGPRIVAEGAAAASARAAERLSEILVKLGA